MAAPVSNTISTAGWWKVGHWTKEKGFPDSIKAPLQRLTEDDKIQRCDLFTTLASACLIEAGFVPLRTGTQDPARSVEDLMALNRTERYKTLLNDLLDILISSGTPNGVRFRVVCANKLEEAEGSPAPGTSQGAAGTSPSAPYSYGTEVTYIDAVNLEGQINISLIDVQNSKNFHLIIDPFLEIQDGESKSILSFATIEDRLNAVGFSDKFKHDVAYPMLDSQNGLCPENRGLDNLPNEMIMELTKYLDVRSCVKLSSTCRRLNRTMAGEKMFKLHYKNMRRDFHGYGWNLPDFYLDQLPSRPREYRTTYISTYRFALRFWRVDRNFSP